MAGPPPLSRNRDFNLLWTGQAASNLGTELSEISYPLLILAVTGSAGQAGLVGGAGLVAHLLALLPAGVVADRYPRKRIMIASALAQLLVVGTVPPMIITGHILLTHLAAVGALQGIASAFYMGASRGAIRRIVPPAQLADALARTQARDQAASLVGPPAGGALFGLARFLPFACDAVSFGAIALAAAFVRGPMDPEPDPSAQRRPLWRSITDGMRYVFTNPYLRTVAIWAAAINTTATGMLFMLIVLARYRGGGPALAGVAIAAGAVGGLAGALLSARLIRLLPGRRMVLVASWVLTVCPIGTALAPSPWLIGLTGALALFVIMPVNVILLARAAELTPHEMQAQTGNAMLLVGNGLKWLAPPVFGTLADTWSPVTATLVGAVLFTCTAAWLQSRPVLHQLNHPVPREGTA